MQLSGSDILRLRKALEGQTACRLPDVSGAAGPKGDKGDTGQQGPPGPPGPPGTTTTEGVHYNLVEAGTTLTIPTNHSFVVAGNFDNHWCFKRYWMGSSDTNSLIWHPL